MDLPAHAERERRILALWEGAVGRSRWRRDDSLLAEAGVPQELGARNRALLAIRNALFGSSWPLRSDCPACGGGCEFAVDSHALFADLEQAAPASPEARLDWKGRSIALRAPNAADLHAIAGHGDVAAAARALMARCLPAEMDPSQLDEAEFELLEDRIEGLDAAAMIAFALDCPACGHHWSAPVDVAEALWTELQRAAERSLTDIDALARTYGWSEEQVLSLTPVRRAAYLQLAVGA